MANDLLVFLTSSAGYLEPHAAAGWAFGPQVPDHTYFDEGPRISNRDVTATSNSDLSASYPYLQGVEISRQAQYDAGLVKVWSGEPGHRLSPSTFGQDKNFFPNPGFADLDLFDPVRYLKSQEAASPLTAPIFTFPIITGDNDQLENYNFNGIIEPLPIRPVVAFFSIDAPFEAHGVRATLMGGNTNQVNGTEQVLTVDRYEPTQEVVGFLDMVDIIEGHPLNGYFRHEFTTVLPFVDERLVRNAVADTRLATDMASALSLMSGSTDNYVGPDQRSATCGWYYDNNASLGTDSLAFGGMTY